MKNEIMTTRDVYETQRAGVVNMKMANRQRFAQLIGEHAVHMCDLAQADRKVDKKRLMQTWADVSKLNDEWVGLVCLGEHPESDFTKGTSKLVTSYSNAIGDFVVDRKVPDNMDEIVESEATFYNTLSSRNYDPGDMKTQWVAYTGAILSMVASIDRAGCESASFYDRAAQCIRSGVLLGRYMDHTLYNK